MKIFIILDNVTQPTFRTYRTLTSSATKQLRATKRLNLTHFSKLKAEYGSVSGVDSLEK